MNSPVLYKAFRGSILLLFVCSSALYAKDDPYRELARELSSSASQLTNPKIAVVPFSYIDRRQSAGGNIVSERLVTRLVKIGKYKVIERELLQNVMQELHFEASGAVDMETTKKLGKVLGVEAIITGSLMDSGTDNAELNARVIKTETAEVIATASAEVPKDWIDASAEPASVAPAVQAAAASGTMAPQEASAERSAVRSETPRQVARKPKVEIHGFVDFLYGSGNAKMDMTLKNSAFPFRESELGLDINGNGTVETVRSYRQVKFSGAKLAADTPPLGLRLAGFGEHWGGAYELSYYSYTMERQKTTLAVNGGSGTQFSIPYTDYFKVSVLNLVSGDLMFRFAKGWIQPYVGLGLGMTLNFISSSHIYGYKDGVYSDSMDDAEIGFLFRVPIGLRVNFSDHGSAFVEYRPTTNYFSFDRDVANETDSVSMSFDYVMLGLGYKF